MNSRLPVWLIASMALASVLALFSIVQRHRVEARNKAVALAAEYETIEALAASQGIGMPDAVEKLKLQGLNAIVLGEETIGELENSGRIQMRPNETGQTLQVADPETEQRVQRGLSIRMSNRSALQGLRVSSLSADLLRTVSVGLNPRRAALARNHGLQIVMRATNPQGITEGGVRETLRWGHELGATVFLPMGDQVLGRRDSIDATVETLQELQMLYASPEFSRIGGNANVVAAAPEIVVRLHAAQAAELDKLTMVDAVERYGKAARERNMRMLLVRPVSNSGPAPLDEFGAFLKAIGDQIRKEGGGVGKPKVFTAPEIPRFLPMLIALAAMPMVWYAAAAMIVNRRVRVAGAVLLALLGLAAYVKTGLHISGLVIAIFAPVAGYAALLRWLDGKERARWHTVLGGFLLVSVFSLVGGMCIAGMLNGLPFYVGADEFRGVKVSTFLPVLLVGALLFVREMDWRGAFRSPITWGTAALGVTILVALMVMVMRSGNDTGAGASDTELMFRNFLDRILYVRPRTKEFLFGHPMLVIGVGLAALAFSRKEASRQSAITGWAILALMVSAVGQTSIVNTMTHAHIPVLLSLARVVEGLVIGCIIGLILWAVVSRLAAVRER